MRNGCRRSALRKACSAQEVVSRLPWHPRNPPLPETFLRLVLVVLSLAGMALGQSQSQAPPQPQSQQKEESLGDSARKAKAKKGKSEPGKVYTEEDLSGLRRGSVSVVGQETPRPGATRGASVATASPEAKNSDAKPKASDAAKPGKTDEEYWRGRVRKLREQMAAVDRRIENVKDEMKKSGSAGFDVNSGLRQAVIYVDDRNARLKKLEKQREELQKQMDLLEEEGRKAGAPPGWFR